MRTRIRDFIPYLPLLFFICWDSGIVHSIFQLTTPMYVVSLISGLSILIFFSWKRFEKARALGIIIFFMLFLLRNPVPYIFLLLFVAYYFYRNEYLQKTFLILIPLAVVDGLGLALNIWLTLLITFAFFLIAALNDLGSAKNAEIKTITKAVLYVSLVLLFIGFSSFDPLAQEKNDKVAYDGYHHKLDSAFFKNDSLTNSTLRYLASIGYEPKVLNEAISPESLKDSSILILETPEEKYTPQEVSLIVDFVRNGGGLFVLGDHTNIMYCYENLNPILQKFGLQLNFDYSMLWEPHFASLAGFDSIEETAGATMTSTRFDSLIFYALKYTTWADLGDWLAKNNNVYIGDVMPGKNDNYGVLPICISTNYGKGRVVAIANSDCMSGSNLLYNYDFIEKVMAYLNYENSFIRSSWFMALLVILIILCVLWVRLSAVKPLAISMALVLILVQIQAVVSVTSQPGNMIALDVGHANVEGYGVPHQYKNIFFAIFAQHYGFNPVLVKDVPEDLSKYKAYVTMGPTESFNAKEMDNLWNYVQNGGLLILFDGYHSDTSAHQLNDAANSLLKKFDIALNNTLLGEISYFNDTTWGYHLPYWKEAKIAVKPLNDQLMNNVDGNITMYSAVEVLGGTPIALYKSMPVISQKRIGRGQIIVVGDHTVFKDFVKYEPTFYYPDPNLKKFIENLFVSMGGKEQNGV